MVDDKVWLRTKKECMMCYQALAEEDKYGLPRRFRRALEGLIKHPDLKILPADKGGGLVVIKKEDFVNKMLVLLNDADTVDRRYKAR